ncbi:MAG: hypothetical protein ACETVY_07045 [Candidatus Bathyarchaeia archaeon]
MVDLIAGKASILEEILKIDDEIRQIKKDSIYLKIKRNLRRLENVGSRSPVVTAPSPDNLDEKIEVRRRSKEMKEAIQRYRERRSEFDERINQLYSRRMQLEKRIFE